MNRTFAVTYSPEAGPSTLFIVSARSRLAAIDQSVAFCRSVDMDAVDAADFSASALDASSVMILKSAVEDLDGVSVEGR